MSSTRFKTIILKGSGIRKEAIADGAITPGHLVYLKSTGKVGVHASATGHAQIAFAVEDDLQGKAIETAYTTATLVQYEVMQRGSEVYAILKDGENVAIGDPLESAGNGELQKHVTDLHTDSSDTYTGANIGTIVGYAMTAVDMSDSTDADPSPRIVVEVA